MSGFYFNTTKEKYKHLSPQQIETIVMEVTKFEAAHKGQKRNTGKTKFIQDLATQVGCSPASVYRVLKDAEIQVLSGLMLATRTEKSASAAVGKRELRKKKISRSKAELARPFLDLIVQNLKENKLASIDEQIHWHQKQADPSMMTVSTKTFYNYVHQGLVDIKPVDLPRMVRRKRRKSYKTYIPKRQKGVSIDQRDPSILSREEFGHWEGDLVTGPKDGKRGAYLTLLERKTRFYLILPIKNKSAKQVYMQINRLEKQFGEGFKDIFKTITFDNGSEFARWKDMEIKPGRSEKRTSVYFAHPYRSCERGSNENCNGLVRRVYPKGTDLGKVSSKASMDLNRMINQKPRKILRYERAEDRFLDELGKIGFKKISFSSPGGRERNIPYLQNLLF